jgi:hypothetical protein
MCICYCVECLQKLNLRKCLWIINQQILENMSLRRTVTLEPAKRKEVRRESSFGTEEIEDPENDI